jgi:hypothetical protein
MLLMSIAPRRAPKSVFRCVYFDRRVHYFTEEYLDGIISGKFVTSIPLIQ